MNHSPEQLALFGRNRYHDWVIFFIATVLLIIVGILYDVSAYLSTQAAISGTTDIVAAPSQFERFKKDVDTLDQYLKNDPSLP